MYPEVRASYGDIYTVLAEAYTLGSSVYREDAANAWAEHFTIPIQSIREDQELFTACNGSFQKLLKAKRARVDNQRLSIPSICTWISTENPERPRLLKLARHGIELCAPASYTGVTLDTRPKLGRAFLATAAAVEKMMYDTYWSKGLAVILEENLN